MGWMNDLRLAGRALARRPGYTAATGITLALGIGATVAIFTVVNAVLLRPLPYGEADRIVTVLHHAPGLNLPVLRNSQGTINFYRQQADVFSAFAGFDLQARNLLGGGAPERVGLVAVEPSLFDVLGVLPALGRPLTEADAQPDASPVAIVTDAAWHTRFGGDREILGRTMQLDGASTEIVGVMPPDFAFGDPDAVAFVPYWVDPHGAYDSFGIRTVARLAPGVDLATAQRRTSELQARLPDFLDQAALDRAGWSATVERYQDTLVGNDVASALWIVLTTVGFLLLVAGANVANLFLVRAESRQKELAVRAALGAGGRRIATGFLGEALLLGVAGGAAGVLLAWGGVGLLVAHGPAAIPRLHEVRVDGASLAFAATLSVAASLVLGAISVARYSGATLSPILRDGGRTSTSGRGSHRTRSVMVTAQLALALLLLVGSGLMLRTFDRLRSVHPGFDPTDVLAVGLSVGERRSPDEAMDFYERVAEAVGALPSVERVALTQLVPTGSGSAAASPYFVEGAPAPEGGVNTVVMYKTIGEGYTDALRIPVIEGRALTRTDRVDDAAVVVVNRAFAELLGGDALGKGIKLGGTDYLRVVGVVGDVQEQDLRTPVRPWAYVPLASTHRRVRLDWMYLMVRTQPGTAPPVAAIREAVKQVDPTVPVTTVRTMHETMARSIAQTSFTMVLLGLAAGVALFLGAIGLFGVISYVVGQRRREIGVRVALGATRADIRSMVFRQSAVVAVVGVGLGLGAALALTGLMRAILFEISAKDPLTFVGAPIILLAVAALATWLPARRAARVDPIEALRAE